MLKLPNEHLLALYKKADVKAFDAFFKRNHRLLFGYLLLHLRRRAEAEAVLRETFARVHDAVVSYEVETNGTLWVFAIAQDALVHALERRSSAAREPEIDEATLADTRASLDELLATLDRDEREAVRTRFIERPPTVRKATSQPPRPSHHAA